MAAVVISFLPSTPNGTVHKHAFLLKLCFQRTSATVWYRVRGTESSPNVAKPAGNNNVFLFAPTPWDERDKGMPSPPACFVGCLHVAQPNTVTCRK